MQAKMKQRSLPDWAFMRQRRGRRRDGMPFDDGAKGEEGDCPEAPDGDLSGLGGEIRETNAQEPES